MDYITLFSYDYEILKTIFLLVNEDENDHFFQKIETQSYGKPGRPQKRGYFLKFGRISSKVLNVLESFSQKDRKKVFITRLDLRFSLDLKKEKLENFFKSFFVLLFVFDCFFSSKEKEMFANSSGLSISLGKRCSNKFWRIYLKKNDELVFELELKKTNLNHVDFLLHQPTFSFSLLQKKLNMWFILELEKLPKTALVQKVLFSYYGIGVLEKGFETISFQLFQSYLLKKEKEFIGILNKFYTHESKLPIFLFSPFFEKSHFIIFIGLLKYFYRHNLQNFSTLENLHDNEEFFTINLKISDFLDSLNWEQTQYNYLKIRTFLLTYQGKKFFFRYSDKIVSSTLFNIKLKRRNHFFNISFTKGFFTCLLAQNIMISLNLLAKWEIFSRTKKLLLLDLYQPLIFTLLALVSDDSNKPTENFFSIIFELFLFAFKNSSSRTTLVKKKKEILYILSSIDKFIIKENLNLSGFKNVEKMFHFFCNVYPFKNKIDGDDLSYLFKFVITFSNSDKIYKTKKKLNRQQTENFLLDLLNKEKKNILQLYCKKLDFCFLENCQGFHFKKISPIG